MILPLALDLKVTPGFGHKNRPEWRRMLSKERTTNEGRGMIYI
jgi:hypothetical protein